MAMAVAEFGPISPCQEDIGTEFLAVMAITMDYEEHFHEFMITFSRRMSHVQGTPAQARGLLLSDRNTNVLKKQVLPDRLMEAARRCKDDSKMYDECIVYLRNKDQEQHAAGQLKPNSKKVMALSNQEAAPRSTTRKCYNCGNFGHLQGDCLSNFCGYCKKFDVNHHSGECPRRGTDNKSSTSTQEQKKVQVEARKTRSRGKAEKEQAGKSKRKGSEGPKPLKRLKSEAKEESMAESEGEMDDEEFDDEESSEPRTSKAYGAWMRPNGDGKRLRMLRARTTRTRTAEHIIHESESMMAQCQVKKVMSARSKQNVQASGKRPMYGFIDTGSAETVVPNVMDLKEVDEEYDEDNQADTSMMACNGHTMTVTAVGSLNETLDKVYAVDGLESILVSGPQLQKKGRWIVIPPTDVGRDIGVIVCDKFGNVEMIGDQEMITDINAMNTYASKIELPDISRITEKRKALRAL